MDLVAIDTSESFSPHHLHSKTKILVIKEHKQAVIFGILSQISFKTQCHTIGNYLKYIRNDLHVHEESI